MRKFVYFWGVFLSILLCSCSDNIHLSDNHSQSLDNNLGDSEIFDDSQNNSILSEEKEFKEGEIITLENGNKKEIFYVKPLFNYFEMNKATYLLNDIVPFFDYEEYSIGKLVAGMKIEVEYIGEISYTKLEDKTVRISFNEEYDYNLDRYIKMEYDELVIGPRVASLDGNIVSVKVSYPEIYNKIVIDIPSPNLVRSIADSNKYPKFPGKMEPIYYIDEGDVVVYSVLEYKVGHLCYLTSNNVNDELIQFGLYMYNPID